MRKLNKLELLLVVVLLIIGIVRVVDTIELTPRRLFSVHDLNWDYFEDMNEFIVHASFSNPPYVFDDYIHGIGHLGVLLEFFSENYSSLHDRQRNQRYDFTMRFSGITGEEKFLGDIPSSVWESNNGEFEFKFYFDREIEDGFFEHLREANRRRTVADNPSLETRYIPLSEVDWGIILESFDETILSLRFEGFERTDYPISNFFSFIAGSVNEETVSVIIHFLVENKNVIKNIIEEDTRHSVVIFYRPISENKPRYMTIFHLTEELYLMIVEHVGEEIWEAARRPD